MFCGNKTIFDTLIFSAKNRVLPHAIVLCGPASIGKTTLGKELAKAILGKTEHPDFWFFENEDGWKLETIRDLQNFLNTSSFAGDFKVALVPRADLMTEEAANAILKTLEEPPPNRLIIFTSEKKEKLLPTIASRSSAYTLNQVTLKEISEFLISDGADFELAEKIASLSLGRPGRAKQMMLNPKLLERTEKLREFLKSNKNSPLFKVFVLAEKISKMDEHDQRVFWEELLYFISQSKFNKTKFTNIDKILKFDIYKKSYVQSRLMWDNFLLNVLN
jgi:hypothetical protein